ncbi:MAG: sensor histidine kinase [Acetanaerobacterium sp.]
MFRKSKKRRQLRLRIRHKIILSINLVLFPVLILAAGFTYYRNYIGNMEQNARRYRATVQALDENIRYFERDLTDIMTYFCVDDEILRVLGGGVSTDDRLFWTSHAPMEFIRSILAIKSQITTLVLYPENGLAPFYVSRDASVPILDVSEIRKLAIYQKAVDAQGDVVWSYAGASDQSLFTANKSDKILLCREIFDLSKKERLGFLFIGVHVEQYRQMCENALLYDNESVVLLGEDSSQIVASKGENPGCFAGLAEDLPAESCGGMMEYDGNYIFSVKHPAGGRSILYISPAENWRERANSGLVTPVILGVVLLVSIWPLSIIASRVISRPLSRLCSSMNRFKEGDFDTQIAIIGNDEIAELSETFNIMVREIKDLINRNYVMVLHERESELAALQAQINPHFLYNTLDSLYWQAIDAGQDKLAEDVLSLSELFRLLLSSGQSEIPVEQELRIVSHYLNIQKMRFSKKLEYSIDVSAEMMELPIPKLVIQPFVENAIVHGLERHDTQGRLSVTGRLEDGMIRFTIADNGVGMTGEQLSRVLSPGEDRHYAKQRIGNYAIRNVKERLDLRYGERFKLAIESSVGEGTTVTIEFPASDE